MLRRTLLPILGTAVLATVAPAQTPAAQKTEKLAPYYPTPEFVVEKMLQFGGLKRGERMFDLGSGDGRLVIMASQKFGAALPVQPGHGEAAAFVILQAHAMVT